MKSKLSEFKDTALFQGLVMQTGGWIDLALAEAGLPSPGDDAPDAPGDFKEAAAMIARRWLEEGAIEAGWNECSEAEQNVLRAGIGNPRVSRGTLVRYAVDRGHSPGEVDQALAGLERKALLLPFGGPASASFYIPREIGHRLARLLNEDDGPEPLPSAPPTATTQDHGSAFIDDFTTMLGFLRRGAFRVTRGGGVHAADLRRIATRLIVPEEIPAADSLEAGPVKSEIFPTRLGLIVELAEKLHLIHTEPATLRVDARRVRSWLARASVDVHRDVVRAARRESWRYNQEVSALAGFLGDQLSNVWFRIEDVASALDSHNDFVGMRPEDLRNRITHAATYLCWMGVAACAPDETRPSVIALTPLGESLLRDPDENSEAEPATLAVLPNFEVLMPVACDLATRCELETFADPANKARGPMRTYKLERASLLAAMKSGITLTSVISFLDDRSEGVPENVKVTLTDWAGSYGSYYFMQPTLLVCRDAPAAAAARTNPRIADRVLGMLTPEIVILQPESVDVVRNALEVGGSMPRPGLKRLPIGGPLASDVSVMPRIPARRKSRASNSRSCVMEGCTRAHTARGLCATHYQQARRGKISFPE